MSNACHSKMVVKQAFDDVALLIGSVAAARKLSDDLVQVLITRLDRVRARTLRRLSADRAHDDGQGHGQPARLHPAVEGFLFRGQDGANDARTQGLPKMSLGAAGCTNPGEGALTKPRLKEA
jgi:hypothetical protein